MRCHLLLFLLISHLWAFSTSADSEEPSVKESVAFLKSSQVAFTQSGDIQSIPAISSNRNGSIPFNKDIQLFLELRISGDRTLDSCIRSVPVHLSEVRTDSTIQLDYKSDLFMGTLIYEKQYLLNKKNHLVDISYKVSGDTSHTILKQCFLQLIIHPISTKEDPLKFVNVNKKSKKVFTKYSAQSDSLTKNAWIGMRTRFHATLFTSNSENSIPAHFKENSLVFGSISSTTESMHVRMYCGPVQYNELRSAGNECTRLLYPLWFWMRWLSIGLLLLFDGLLKVFGNVVVSVVMLSICVKIIIAPLFKIANKWQKQVNSENSLLQPRLIEIKSKYKGEELNKQTFALYKELGINPLYSLKSLLSAAIQIPIFFAAYHMLSEHIALNGIPFLWIKDLSFPDHAVKLPFTLPYFGEYLNILPFIMTSITFASSWLHKDHSLSPVLRNKQRSNLYLMAALFFVLLYTSPAGMVIYWTMNNLLAFISTLFEQTFTGKDKAVLRPEDTGQIEQRTQSTAGSEVRCIKDRKPL